MKILVIIIKFILIAGLVLVFSLWMIVHGSGYEIPARSDLIFGALCGVLVLLIWFLFRVSSTAKK